MTAKTRVGLSLDAHPQLRAAPIDAVDVSSPTDGVDHP